MPAVARSRSGARSRSRSHAPKGTPAKHGTKLDGSCIATVRCLSADQPTAGKSGHPGAPMGCAPIAHALWGHLMHFSPMDPRWPNRDRFTLSNGHACALQYSMLHLTGYDLPISELEKFRHLHSKAPGHPENFQTPGVEVCTGPLGQGLSNAVGFAIARMHLAAKFNRPGFSLFDSAIYTICGDGCMMEGITTEACELAGELGVSGLVCAYDDNNITIDGSTDLAFTDDVGQRFQAFGWDVTTVEDGDTDLGGILASIQRGRSLSKAALITVKTTIGCGSVKANTAHIHGTPLTAEDLQQMRNSVGFPDHPFHVPKKVGEYYRSRGTQGDEQMTVWRRLLDKYRDAYPAEHTELDRRLSGYLPTTWWGCLERCIAAPVDEGDAVLAAMVAALPELIGGSVAEAPLLLPTVTAFTAEQPSGRHIAFGSGREHAAAAVCNGLAAFGGLVPFWRCPLGSFANAWGAVRLSALGQFRVLHIATFDGADAGEVLALCRATPNLALARPGDAAEVAGAYAAALGSRTRPTVVVLPPPGSQRLVGSSVEAAARGGYTLMDFPEGPPRRALLVASGPELTTAAAAHAALAARGVGTRVVSLPSWEIFAEQNEEYHHAVLERPRTKHSTKHKPADRHLPIFFLEEAGVAPFGCDHFVGGDDTHILPVSDAASLAALVEEHLTKLCR
mmetsp:Transcript_106467/g.286421  ORF Transcript_106467/g.286421 Transcript_106467/m.286421 type:complete len:677 (+) Transcript_106467:3-2033(+)